MSDDAQKRNHLILNEVPEEALEGLVQALTWLSGEAVARGMSDVGQLIDCAAEKAKRLTSPPTSNPLH